MFGGLHVVAIVASQLAVGALIFPEADFRAPPAGETVVSVTTASEVAEVVSETGLDPTTPTGTILFAGVVVGILIYLRYFVGYEVLVGGFERFPGRLYPGGGMWTAEDGYTALISTVAAAVGNLLGLGIIFSEEPDFTVPSAVESDPSDTITPEVVPVKNETGEFLLLMITLIAVANIVGGLLIVTLL
jgi:hypothetical protein